MILMRRHFLQNRNVLVLRTRPKKKQNDDDDPARDHQAVATSHYPKTDYEEQGKAKVPSPGHDRMTVC